MIENFDEYLSGRRLYGDDLSEDEIRSWYADEGEGYANLGASESEHYKYVYHALNMYHAYRFLKLPSGIKVLGFGSAYGEELLPILNRAAELTIIDPSESFVSNDIYGVPCRYIKPSPSGKMPFKDGEFDLVTAFGVLHHVPNVTTVVKELSRVIKPGGKFLLREPVVSMGDWRQPRPGLTIHERGIPQAILRDIIIQAGFIVRRENYCVYPPVSKAFKLMRKDVYNSRLVTLIDAYFSRLFAWNLTYHPYKWWQKFRPTSVFYVLEKQLNDDVIAGGI